MDPFSDDALKIGGGISVVMASRAASRGSLTPSGILAALVVSFLSIACGFRGFILLIFYQIGTLVTKFKSNTKEKLDGTAATSARSGEQVLACSIIGVTCALAHAYFYGKEKSIDFNFDPQESILACAIIAHYAACLGDTLSSELGMLSKRSPVLISSPMKRVPHGTNGGVTPLGFFVSAVGGALIGLGAATLDFITALEVNFVAYVVYGIVCGVVGSTIDSFLGATLQVTYFDERTQLVQHSGHSQLKHVSGADVLSNVQVNLVSTLLTTAIGPMIAPIIFDLTSS
eukprot:CAMPEP_0197834336 /NCGR_PEP_ID=MMETSP1437-20131217/22062_1 /TAXON_ID=49252 ORGANISM="Eucampia antarctica, Strain CCMP1452" /NCGR_SAMPLE_ID=MMETSP1437 /ASSEMBLY_ACC=CAM_ASM_001096 /LENGTH=286 /DNA_ID=CAMNT_0043438939 /DNA_START=49 /DNA_END=909 /DNA_ORIENTATION=+